MTLDEYIDNPEFVQNWMTCFLTGKFYSPLQKEDLILSGLILHQKALIGLYDKMDESIHCFNTYLDWNPMPSEGEEMARYGRIQGDLHSSLV